MTALTPLSPQKTPEYERAVSESTLTTRVKNRLSSLEIPSVQHTNRRYFGVSYIRYETATLQRHI